MPLNYLPIFILLSIIAEVLGTVGGFGSSVFFVPSANLFFDFKTVLGITALFHLSSNLTKIAMFKQGFDKSLIINLGIPSVLFVIIGAYLSNFLNPKILGYILGVFLIILSLILIVLKNLKVNPTFKNTIIGGILSGLSAGVLGTGGAIRGITLSAFRMDKNKFIATSAIIDLGVDFSRSIVYFNNGYMHKEHLYLIPILIIVGLLGTWLGKRILDKISQDQFRQIVLFLILGIGITSVLIN